MDEVVNLYQRKLNQVSLDSTNYTNVPHYNTPMEEIKETTLELS